jgi:excisionase family DNA binding protein
MDKLFTIAEFAARVGVGRSTLYRENQAQRLPFLKIGRATRIAESDGQAWLAQLNRT